ncbi:MAG: RpiB/LacA/LacB family sugar-phosphate isomerase [Thermoleophilia bacterium]|nr:RpiB/LacA/LacB family sugar-phosphate isomerase [Thermoleophilia bacterium]
MRVTVGSDMSQPVTDAVIAWLGAQSHDVSLVGPLAEGDGREWADVGVATARSVTEGAADVGVLFCWSGTGVCIAANKVPGARAALCGDAETARLARRYNHANVLVMSMRATSPAVAVEITQAFLDEPWGEDDYDIRNVRVVDALD